jgi:hypothetical protein
VLEFEWDEEKEAFNTIKHGVLFSDASKSEHKIRIIGSAELKKFVSWPNRGNRKSPLISTWKTYKR